MSNPGSPAVPTESLLSQRRGSKSDNGTSNENEGISSSCNNASGNGDRVQSVAAHLDPFVRLDPLEIIDGQLQSLKKKSSTGILSKSGKRSVDTAGSTAAGAVADLKSKMDATETPAGGLNTLTHSDTSEGTGNVHTTPSIVKPRRPSVHFAVDAESKQVKIISSNPPERLKQDGGGNRKHRSRKEKLVCRSESPSDLGLETNENRKVSGMAVSSNQISTKTLTPTSTNNATSSALPTSVPPAEHLGNDKAAQSSTKMNPPAPLPPRGTPSLATNKVKSRVKRSISGSNSTRAGGPRKNSPGSSSSSREPLVKKKKVIEIVSPRKRKMDHLDIVKTSSDPIFVRAANKPFKFKNKSQHNRFKFARVNLNKSSGHSSGSRQRRTSSASFQHGSGQSLNKQRLVINSPMKKEPEAEPPCFPPSLLNDLLWVLEDAEKEFSPDRTSSKSTPGGSSSSSRLHSSQAGLPNSLDPIAGGSPAVRKLAFGNGRRRVESEPPGAVGFDLAPTPGSPSGSQPFFHVRKEVYFSPSPSYAATGPSGRRRYSRRRHARIHPPFDDSNCLFQGHHCPNTKVPGSQYCEKHLDQGPTTVFTHCKYMKDGRQCGSLFPNFDSTMTFCDQHANLIARAEYDLRNPKSQPDPARNILAKINKIFTEGLSKADVENLDTATSSPDILQVIEESEVIEDTPLGKFTGGLLEEIDVEGDRNVNPEKPDYDALKNAGYYTTEEIIQIHVSKLRKLKTLYQREKELEWLTRQHKLRFYKEGLEKLKNFGPRFTTNPYLISRNVDLPKEYIDHQIKQYEAAKAILQTAYKADGEKGLLRLKMLQKTQELARMDKASGQKQHDTVDICDSETDADSDSGESRDRRDSSRYTGNKSIKCAYNEGYAIRACQNPPVCWSNYCFNHILSDPKQVQWIPCNRRIGPDPQDTCKTPCLKILQKHGCAVHAPLVMSKHKPLRKSEEELNLLVDSDVEEEEVTLESESQVLANLVSDECISVSHLDEMISRLATRGPLEVTDTSDSEETDEECGSGNLLSQEDDDDALPEEISQ